MNNGGPSRDEREDEARESALPLEDVSRLVELVRESGVGELSVRQGEFEVTVRARPEPAAAPTVQTQPLAQPASVQTQQPAQAVAPDPEERGGETASENGNGDLHRQRCRGQRDRGAWRDAGHHLSAAGHALQLQPRLHGEFGAGRVEYRRRYRDLLPENPVG